MNKVITSCLALAAALTLAQADDARAIPFGFYVIEDNAPQVIEGQLFVDVTDQGLGAILFQFQNLGPIESSITDIYFDDVGILNSMDFVYYPGDTVLFDTPATPPDLPGGGPYSFTADFSADSDNPSVQKGINPGEMLGILFNSPVSFDQVIAHINDGTIRVGLHVQGIGPEGQYSEAFINNPNPAPVPEPATIMLFGSGLVAFPIIRRRFGKR